MALTGGNGGFAKGSFKTRERRCRGMTIESWREQRAAALKKQQEAFRGESGLADQALEAALSKGGPRK